MIRAFNRTAVILASFFLGTLTHPDATAQTTPAVSPLLAALPEKPETPENNPTTAAKVELGKKLYFDPRLSKTGAISCNSCHNVMGNGTDNLPRSFGINGKLGGRNSPTVWNAAFQSVQFWDGRAKTLEEQAKGPMLNPVEMGMENHELVMKRIRSLPGYASAFAMAFGSKESLTIENAAKAIAAYERTLITPGSAFDRYANGNASALSEPAKRGVQLFQTVGCVSCHNGPNLSGPKLPVGTANFQKFPTFAGSTYEAKYKLTEDAGLMTVTQKETDRGLWRVPTLRNVALTAPYFHNGSVTELSEAVRVMGKTQLNRDLNPQEVSDLVAFLESLTGKFPEQKLPRLPESVGTTVIQ